MTVDLQVKGSEDLRALARDLKGVPDKQKIMKELRKEIRKPVPTVRKAIKAKAVDILPKRGGLNRWVASTKITASVKMSAARGSVTLKGGRNSSGGRSDIRAIDQRGRVRAPTFGHRGRGAWHTVTVPTGFFTDTVQAHADEWQRVTIDAVEKAVASVGG